MKKLFLFLAFAVGVSTTSLHAQEQQRDPAQMAQRMKERMKPQLVEQTHITDAQAEQVMDLYIAQMEERRGLRDMSQEDRQKKLSDMSQQMEKRLVSVPLTIDQVRSVMTFFREREQARQNRAGGNRPAGQ